LQWRKGHTTAKPPMMHPDLAPDVPADDPAMMPDMPPVVSMADLGRNCGSRLRVEFQRHDSHRNEENGQDQVLHRFVGLSTSFVTFAPDPFKPFSVIASQGPLKQKCRRRQRQDRESGQEEQIEANGPQPRIFQNQVLESVHGISERVYPGNDLHPGRK
jgi:hypothetical protein